jgi:hypothetical protein
MTATLLKRQYITDSAGKPIGVILPLAEFALVQDILEQRTAATAETEKLEQMKQAVQDPLFIADLRETMTAFAQADAEWWEPVP